MTKISKKISIGFLAVIIAVALSFFFSMQAPVEIKGVTVKKQDVEVTVTATSTGAVKSETEINITSQRTGKITRLYVEEGDRVKTGDLIAELDTSEVFANLNKARADIKRAEVDLLNAASEYRRKEALFKEGLVAQQQFDDATKILSLAEAGFEIAKAARDVAQLQFDYSFVKTPSDGVVSERRSDEGDTTTPGFIIASIVDPEKLYISAPIDEADVSNIALRQKVKISIDAYPGKTFYGQVIKISPIVLGMKQEARTFEVRVSIPVDKLILKPGMSADVEVVIGEAKDALVVPSQAIMEKGADKVVYVSENGKVAQRKINIGIYNWTVTEIKEGLKEGEKIIINPDKPGVKEGVRIKFVDSP